MSDFKPTPAQAAIIEVIASKPDTSVRVDARAGAAKTSTITLASKRIPSSISTLSLAFNKKIAEELAFRLPSFIQCATLNSMGHRAWGERLGKRLQVDADKMHKIAKTLGIPSDEDNADTFINALNLARAAKSVGLVPSSRLKMGANTLLPDTLRCWDDLGTAKGMLDFEDAIPYARQILEKSIDRAWQGEIDFDDQIYMSVLFGGIYKKFHTVIVDEAQDLSPLNHLQIKKLTRTRAIIVGDPYQAIYGFRGADSDSINNLVELLEDDGKVFETLPLSKSFRVPKAVSKLCTGWVPDFGSMDFLPEGKIEHWPIPARTGEGMHQVATGWTLDAIPTHGAVLCRNNAPLMALAFAMIKQKRPVQILGRDIGAQIANLLLKITGKSSVPVKDCWPLLEAWKDRELEKAGDSETKVDIIHDKYEALFVLLDAGGQPDNLKSAEFIRELFSDKAAEYKTTFASIHRAKGLEWDWVMMLDPHRIPSPQAERAKRRGDPGPWKQEMNLEYVGKTRTKGTLVFAALQDCTEMGE